VKPQPATRTAEGRRMAKKRRKRVLLDPESDPLGELKAEYRPGASAILGLAGLFFALGAGLLIYCLLSSPHPWKLMLAAAVLLLLAPVVLAINAPNFGRVLQVRKHGLRFTAWGNSTELAWDEITRVEAVQTKVKQMGVLTMRTEWKITVRGKGGRVIHLSPVFLQHVPDVDKLIRTLRLYAGSE
jgi:hypothetical protein